jgi:hypothetical protein
MKRKKEGGWQKLLFYSHSGYTTTVLPLSKRGYIILVLLALQDTDSKEGPRVAEQTTRNLPANHIPTRFTTTAVAIPNRITEAYCGATLSCYSDWSTFQGVKLSPSQLNNPSKLVTRPDCDTGHQLVYQSISWLNIGAGTILE